MLFEALYRWNWLRTRLAGPDAPAAQPVGIMLIQAGVVAAALLATLGYGEWRLSQDAFTPGPRIALVQGNAPQQIRNDVNMGGVMVAHFVALCDLAAAQEPKPDLIVWPETSFPGGDWCDTAPDAPAPARKAGTNRMKTMPRSDAPVGGAVAEPTCCSAWTPASSRRTAYAPLQLRLAHRPRRQGVGRYDKIHCVPFGEYVPLRDAFPWMRAFAPYDLDYSVSPGRSETRFPLDEGTDHAHSFGVAICYEDTDPDRVRPYGGGDGGPPADFLLNISNDGWFDGTSEHDEHLAICRFRAVECRRSVGRAVNMGISAVIDGNGRVLPLSPVRARNGTPPASARF